MITAHIEKEGNLNVIVIRCQDMTYRSVLQSTDTPESLVESFRESHEEYFGDLFSPDSALTELTKQVEKVMP